MEVILLKVFLLARSGLECMNNVSFLERALERKIANDGELRRKKEREEEMPGKSEKMMRRSGRRGIA